MIVARRAPRCRRRYPLVSIPTYDLVAGALPIALAHDITAYDACYVARSYRLGIPFITGDQKPQAKLAAAP
jgi:predicted nucleic acid-binding protein